MASAYANVSKKKKKKGKAGEAMLFKDETDYFFCVDLHSLLAFLFTSPTLSQAQVKQLINLCEATGVPGMGRRRWRTA